MKIAHIGPAHLPILYPLGGATERRMRELARRQAARGAEVVVYSAEDRAGRKDCGGAEIRALRCTARGTLRSLEFQWKAVRDLAEFNPDVVHFHSLAEGAAFARRSKAKLVLSYDNFHFRRGKSNPLSHWYRRTLKRFDRLLPVSQYCLRESAAYWNLPHEPMQVLYNGVNLEQFRPDPAAGLSRRQALGLTDEFVALYVGRVCLQKGTDLLIEACRQLRAEGRRIRLAVAGPVGQFGVEGGGELTERLQRLGGIYLGPVEENLLPAVYNLCDVFVMPTRAYEMFGMAALEAQACGKPVVCSNHGGLPEVISQESGMLFETGNAESLAEHLRRLMDDAGRRQALARAARPNAARFAWEAIAERLDRLYREQ